MRLPFFYGWAVVGVAFVTMAIGVNARTAFSLLFPPILDEFRWDRGVTAGAFSFGFLVSAFLGPVLGRLMDRRGPRWVVTLGAVLVALGLGLAPLTREPWHLYATLGVLLGGGTVCLGYTGHAMYLPNWFVRRRGLAVSIAFSGVGVGSIVLLPWIQVLISTGGWRWACVVIAVLMLTVGVPLNLMIPHRRPEDLGLHPDGDAAVASVPGGGAARADNVVDATWAATDWTLARAIRTTRFWWIALAFATGMLSWYAVQVHQTKYLLEIGFAPGPAAYALGLVSFAGIFGQIVLGHLSDRIGREWVWTLGCLGFALCYALLLAMKDYPSPMLLYLMVATQGVLGYGITSVFGAIPAEIFQGRHFGSIFGMLTLASLLGGALGPWMTGALHDHTGSYALGFGAAIVSSGLSALAVWLAAPRKVRTVAGRALRGPTR
ncbi:MAG: MFS transporter [Candidatus Rokuibacteriota bacterium]